MHDQQEPHQDPGGQEDHSEPFGEVVRENQMWVRGYFRSRLRDWASADDLAQDVFVTAYLNFRTFRGDSSVRTWLRGIAQNHLRNFIRKHREVAAGGSTELQALLEQSCAHSEEVRPTHEKLDALQECLQRLPDQARKLLGHRYVMGSSVREISEETGKGYSALSMQFHRLRESLAECIRRELQRSEA
ncbi:RNA polymerase sigma factor [Haloferula sp. A504]|uniref:RNA polymerase sigma factor n=1 Tax=Haloferula sp. A504 TaxID=3373601 RepID=UPI0031BCBB7C|nr:sigma-70 family RNA polymerase sigma factor [Verrucomicrobiaceae bacterium E54]